MKRFWTTVSGVLLLGGVVSVLFTAEASIQSSFWNDLAQGNMTEIAASNVAVQRAQNEQVRQFAQQMVADHTAAAAEMQTVAAGENVTLPTAMSAKQQSEITKLSGRTGNDFDRDYMKMMVKDHERMAKLLQRESERNADAEVKAFAAKTLPVVQGHLTHARTINESLRGSSGSSGSNRGANSNRSNSNSSGDDDNRDNSNSNRGNMNRGNSNRNTNTNTNNGNVNR